MKTAELHAAVKQAIAEAEQACDPLQNTLMDRADLQRVIEQLKEMLEQVERECGHLEDQRYGSGEPLAPDAPGVGGAGRPARVQLHR